MNLEDNKYSILLVDDEKDIRDVVQLTLTDMGHHVHVAENGKEAIRLYQKINPPVVITDIKMPGMDGIELLKNIKQINPETEVIMISGHGDMNLAIKSLQNEAVDFVTKPINVDGLEISLKRVHERIYMKRKIKEYTENLETLVKEKTELQDRLSSLGMMIGSVSHNIKGLLTSLDGGIFLLNSGLKSIDSEKLQDGFDIVKLISGRIKKMVLDILYYAKERELAVETIDVPLFAQSVIDVIMPKARDRKIEIVRDFEKAPKTADFDSDLLRSALINLLDNAIDACLECENERSHQIVFRIKDCNENMDIEVHDTGIGMDSDTLENLFQLFFSSKGDKGTGFGLFITNNIIRQHNGIIRVTSAKGKGSMFSIKIPKTQDKYQTAS